MICEGITFVHKLQDRDRRVTLPSNKKLVSKLSPMSGRITDGLEKTSLLNHTVYKAFLKNDLAIFTFKKRDFKKELGLFLIKKL